MDQAIDERAPDLSLKGASQTPYVGFKLLPISLKDCSHIVGLAHRSETSLKKDDFNVCFLILPP